MESFLACSTVAKSLVEIAAAHEIHMGNVCDYNEDCIVLHEFDEDHLTCDGKLLIRTDDIDYFAVHTQYLAVREKAARSLDALNA